MSFAEGGGLAGFSGKIGCQVDRSEEHFGIGTLFADYGSASSPTQTPGEQVLLPEQFRDQSTETSLLFQTERAERGAVPRLRTFLLSGNRRTRGGVTVEGKAGGSFSYGNAITFQGGPAAGGGWFDDVLTLDFRRRRLPGGLDVRLRAPVERSISARDSLPRVFDFTAARPSLELLRRLGWQGDIGLRGGLNARHVTGDPSRSYGEPWAELEWSQFLTAVHSVRLLARSEDRRFTRQDSLLPSYREDSAEGEFTWNFPRTLRARLSADGRQVRLKTHSAFLRDHRILDATLRLDTGLRRFLRRGQSQDSLLLADADAPDLRVGVGGKFGLLRNRVPDGSDYETAGAIAALSLEGLTPLWFDLSLESGRRNYRTGNGLPPILYQDLDLSLSRTSYTYFSGSWLVEARLPGRLGIEGSCFYDRERHDDSMDDVTLWSFTLSLTRTF